jgi:NAD(P)H-quinone oxidoreductase subunit 5
MHFTEFFAAGTVRHRVPAEGTMNLQPDLASTLPTWHAALLLAPALCAGLAALQAGPATATAWRAARWASAAALGFAALSLLAVLLGAQGTGYGLRADAVGGAVMLLVAFVGWVIVRYSQPYLDGEQGESRYVRWLMATLASVAVVLVTNHVLVLALAWTGTSLALHRLLNFFGDRPAAVVAAHKKFIVGRLADLCMLAAAGLLYLAFGTLHLDRLAALAGAAPQLPVAAQAAVLLIVCAALLKCAQLPFHGWLIQVMEAPTPVSALLHAGVVNLGGFVLIRFAPLVSEMPAAQALLVVAGTTTAVLAALVMSTRISVKVMLAWSTCAQMGFMLMQCGLGVWEMALLHLVAHSLYKAHAFLGAGGAVRRTLQAQLAPPPGPARPLSLLLGALLGVGMTLAAAATVGLLAPAELPSPALWVLAAIVAVALVPLLQAQALRLGGWWLPSLLLGAFGVALAYFGLHAVLKAWVAPGAAAPPSALWLGVALAFGALFGLQSSIALAPHGALARWLYPWFYGGLFLDESFNRLAFALWPPPGPAAGATPLPMAGASSFIDPPHVTAGARP